MEAAFLYLSHCVRAIAGQLNERGILTPRGGSFNVCRSAGLAFASVTTTSGASEANGNGSPSRPDLLEKDPLPLFRKIGSKARGGVMMPARGREHNAGEHRTVVYWPS
jgi:hypothetical protein